MSQNQSPGEGRIPQPGQASPEPVSQPYEQPSSYATPPQPYAYPSQQQPYAYPSQQAPSQPYAYPSQQAPGQPYGYQQAPSQPYAYPQQQAPGQPYAYLAQGQNQPYAYPVEPYAQPGGVAPLAGYTPPRTEKRSPFLGALALVLVVVCGIALGWTMWRFGDLVGPLMVNESVDVSNQPELQRTLASELGGVWSALVWGSVTLGFAGWVMGIVAAATRRGRALGVTAIVLGVLAPFAAVGALAAALAPYISS